MRSAIAVCTLLVGLCAGTALADEGQVSQSQLAAMGLGQMQVLTDSEGQEIRGMGGIAITDAAAVFSSRKVTSAGAAGSLAIGGKSAFSLSAATASGRGASSISIAVAK